MKTVIAFFFLGFTVCFSHSANLEWLKYSSALDDDELSYVPQIDGTFRLMSHKQAKLEYNLLPQPRSDLEVHFLLYTRLNPDTPQYVKVNNTSSLSKSNFNPKRPTRFVTHGWLGHSDAKLNRLLRPSLLARDDYNVFIVDWSSGAKTFNYLSARYKVDSAAKKLAEFIEFLHTAGGMKFEDLTLIGHSLGAHVSGIAGKMVTKGKVKIIFGLDPAYPLFSYKFPEERLAPEDAEYVQTIHTNGGYLSFLEPLGHASFYPNWGTSQPGCGFDTAGVCAHRRSWEYYAESLQKNNSFVPFDCIEFHMFQRKSCFHLVKSARMGGEPADYGYVKGIFYVPTNSKKPYGLGVVEK